MSVTENWLLELQINLIESLSLALVDCHRRRQSDRKLKSGQYKWQVLLLVESNQWDQHALSLPRATVESALNVWKSEIEKKTENDPYFSTHLFDDEPGASAH